MTPHKVTHICVMQMCVIVNFRDEEALRRPGYSIAARRFCLWDCSDGFLSISRELDVRFLSFINEIAIVFCHRF